MKSTADSIIFEIKMDTTFFNKIGAKRGDEEFDAGLHARLCDEKRSPDWSLEKQKGWFVGQLSLLATNFQWLENEMREWQKSCDQKKKKIKKMKIDLDGNVYIEEENDK